MTQRLAPETIVDGRYKIEHRLGSGGMADVYCATDLQLGRRVALKVLYRRFAADPEFVERFRREASAAAGLQHQHIVSVYDRGEWDGTYYIAMEYLDGRSLKQAIQQEAPLDPDVAVDYAIQILKAARFAHRRGIIHRDLKPHNVIVDDEGVATVTDFGIARAGASDMTQTGSIMGTAQYLSPEQAQGHAVSQASDLYSVGIVVYEMLTGRVPFDGESAVAIALKQVGEPPLPPSALNPEITPELEAVVLKALAKAPQDRYPDADSFIADLERARAGMAVEAPTDVTRIAAGPVVPIAPRYPDDTLPPALGHYGGGAAPARRPPVDEDDGPSRRWWLFALLALLVVGGVIAAVVLTRTKQVTVPKVTGLSLSAAQSRLERDGFVVRSTQAESDKKVGVVLKQDPPDGEKADEGSTVNLTVSGGLGTRTVPPVEGLDSAQARAALLKVGFKVRVVKRSSDTVQEGDAIATDPPGGSERKPGTTIKLIVSSGVKQVDVPNVIGQDATAATTLLKTAGFVVRTTEREDENADPGTVLDQDPKDTKVDPGATVTLVVAKLPTTVDVPDVVGEDQATGEAALTKAGFKVQATTVDVDSEDQEGLIVEQNPQNGKRPRGSTVAISVGRYVPPPDTTGGGGTDTTGAGTGGTGDGTTGGTGATP